MNANRFDARLRPLIAAAPCRAVPGGEVDLHDVLTHNAPGALQAIERTDVD